MLAVATENDDTERPGPIGEARARGDDDRVSFTRVPREHRNDTPHARVLLRRATHGGDMLARAEHPEEEVRARAGVVVRTLVDQVDGIRPAARAAHEEAPFGLPDDDAELFEVRRDALRTSRSNLTTLASSENDAHSGAAARFGRRTMAFSDARVIRVSYRKSPSARKRTRASFDRVAFQPRLWIPAFGAVPRSFRLRLRLMRSRVHVPVLLVLMACGTPSEEPALAAEPTHDAGTTPVDASTPDVPDAADAAPATD